MKSFDMSIPVGYWVDNEHHARGWLEHFMHARTIVPLGIDTETTGLDRIRDRVLVWSISDGYNRICMPAKFLYLFKDLLESPLTSFDGTNIKFDAHMLANMGIDISKAGEWHDTVVQSWLLNENNLGRHGLKECIVDHFGRATPKFEKVFGKVPPKRKDKITGLVISKTVGDLITMAFDGGRPDMSPEDFQNAEFKKMQAADYASLDAYNSHVLREFFDDKLADIPTINGRSLLDHYYDIEVPFTKILWKMERRGITADGGYLKTRQGPMEKEMRDIEQEFAHAATSMSGQPRVINLQSVPDVRFFFHGLLNKPVVKMTDGGASGNKQPSVDSDVLDQWAGEGDQWAQKLRRYRSIAKIYGTYVVGLQQWIDPLSKIHTTFKHTGAVTGRLSSADPNLMNIPRPDEDEYKIREGFIHSEGKTLIVADYEQIEMRLMAHFSNDEKMIKAINDGTDIHCLTVAEMNGIPYEEVMAAKKADKLVKEGKLDALTPRQEELLIVRQGAKATGFGIIYGIGGALLAANLTKDTKKFHSEQDGNQLIEKWLSIFPGVRAHINKRKTQLWQQGYIQTITGRYRRFGDLKGMSRRDRGQAERQGVNAEVQGSAADITKLAMIAIDNDAELEKLGYVMMLQVHDEIVGECNDDKESVTKVKKRKQDLMENALGYPLKVRTPASVGSGENWAHAK